MDVWMTSKSHLVRKSVRTSPYLRKNLVCKLLDKQVSILFILSDVVFYARDDGLVILLGLTVYLQMVSNDIPFFQSIRWAL